MFGAGGGGGGHDAGRERHARLAVIGQALAHHRRRQRVSARGADHGRGKAGELRQQLRIDHRILNRAFRVIDLRRKGLAIRLRQGHLARHAAR